LGRLEKFQIHSKIKQPPLEHLSLLVTCKLL